MNLNQLLNGVNIIRCDLSLDLEVTGLADHGGEVKPGMLFAALTGYQTDGHLFIPMALKQGAVAVLCEEAPLEEGPWIVVEDSRLAWAQLSANWFGHPARGLSIIGVTGTNGKTTTTYLLKAVLEEAMGAKVGLIGTNQILMGDVAYPVARTTPAAYQLQELLYQMRQAGCSHVVMEVSSHALVLHRCYGILFTAGIFTNLTQDHLDFHGTMEAYAQAKKLLFAQCQLAILNLDDQWGRSFAQEVDCPLFTYSERRDEADLVAKNPRLFPSHVEFEVVTGREIGRVFLPIPGGFTIYNALGVISCGLQLGIPLPAILSALRKAKGVKGRIEVVPVPRAYTVIIDYAHTPDALENILTTLRDLTEGQLICVFGCGGNRDRGKRSKMGAIAADLADDCILTSDNPRCEEPMQILSDIEAGFAGSDTPYLIEPHRPTAIYQSLDRAQPGDVVLLAGKGHETYQEIQGVRYPLDEREVVKGYFEGGN